MFQLFVFMSLSFWLLTGVFADSGEVKSVMEGDSVTLESGVAELQEEDVVTWLFGPKKTQIAEVDTDAAISSTSDGDAVGFRNRLKLDNQTGSLTIMNTRIADSGVYQISISGKKKPTTLNFSVTVYAHLPVPVLIRDCSSSSSSSVQSNCSMLCSVVNVSAVSLSWYKGNSVLSSISVSDLSISLTLPLEVEYQDNNTYSCVINNTISNQTTHLDIKTLCQPCPATSTPDPQTPLHSSLHPSPRPPSTTPSNRTSGTSSPTTSSPNSQLILISAAAAAGSLISITIVGIIWICKNSKKTDQKGKCYRMLTDL
uniref:SLAM family member 6-like n=1 Tax=Danio rerio TaxID=7955 RepID=F8W5Q1_DANRE|nr:SLAM family member 6-like [Danio rerio]|eukprot:XP_017208709.1 SLAM family member 6-like [Danio rerio]